MKTIRLSILLASSVFAQGTEGPAAAPSAAAAVESDSADAKAAKEVLQKYLVSVKAKKWADVKKFLHPKTVESIAERKKRLGKEDHPMAPWFQEKHSLYMKEFKIGAASEAPLGTIVVEVTEDNFMVEEKGMSEGDKAAYLLGRKGGKWFVVDKKRGESYSKDSVKLGYKGYFDEVKKVEAAPE
jgi:hypothetical protein